MSKRIKVQRSAIETYQRCPRRRWNEYEDRSHGGVVGGWTPDKPAFALETGSGFHKGMELVLGWYKEQRMSWASLSSQPTWLETLEAAVKQAVATYNRAIEPYFKSQQQQRAKTGGRTEFLGMMIDDDEDGDEPFNLYTVGEGRAMTEALIRGYCAAPSGLAALLEDYEIIEVEQELEAPLDSDGQVMLMARPDGILRSRRDRQLYVLSFKTTSTWDKRKSNAGEFDTQGMSELIAAEHHYGEKFAGVVMQYAVKGYKSQDKEDKIWKHNNGITRPYYNATLDEYAYSYDYINTSGESKRLGKGWYKTNIWEQGQDALKEWVAKLTTENEPNCNSDWLDRMVVSPQPYYRNEGDIEEWKVSTVWQETQIAQHAANINSLQQRPPDGLKSDFVAKLIDRTLAEVFPKYRHSCSYPTPCPFIGVCHRGDPLSANFKPRVANHPNEVQ